MVTLQDDPPRPPPVSSREQDWVMGLIRRTQKEAAAMGITRTRYAALMVTLAASALHVCAADAQPELLAFAVKALNDAVCRDAQPPTTETMQ